MSVMDGDMDENEDRAAALLAMLTPYDEDARRDADRRRLSDAEFGREYDLIEEKLSRFALDCAVARAPSAAVWARIEARIPDREEADVRVIREEALQWTVWSPGVEAKILTTGQAGEPEAMLFRIAPRAAVPAHHHDRVEECLVLEGDLQHAGDELRAGDFTVARAGGQHAAMTSRGGALLYVRYLAA